jgi:hypothetical protein
MTIRFRENRGRTHIEHNELELCGSSAQDARQAYAQRNRRAFISSLENPSSVCDEHSVLELNEVQFCNTWMHER